MRAAEKRPMNVNGYVFIKLTERGKEILKEEHESIKKIFPNAGEFHLPEEDENGFSRWQLWTLMEMFGRYVFNGCIVPFETEILVEFKGDDNGSR